MVDHSLQRLPLWPAYEVLMPLAPWEKPEVLAAALESLRLQCPAPRRLVLSVDGVLPGALAQVVERSELPVLQLAGPGGEGVGLVLARGLAACECELILRADADDLSCPDRAARQLDWFARHPALVAGSAWIEEFEDGLPDRSAGIRAVPTGQALSRSARWRNPLNHPAVVFRREQVVAVGGYRHRPGFEDYDLWLRLLRSYGPCCLNNLPLVLVLARVGPQHLQRRWGWRYARAEAGFLWRSAMEGQLSWGKAAAMALIRLPWRLLPRPCLALLMRLGRS